MSDFTDHLLAENRTLTAEVVRVRAALRQMIDLAATRGVYPSPFIEAVDAEVDG